VAVLFPVAVIGLQHLLDRFVGEWLGAATWTNDGNALDGQIVFAMILEAFVAHFLLAGFGGLDQVVRTHVETNGAAVVGIVVVVVRIFDIAPGDVMHCRHACWKHKHNAKGEHSVRVED